MYHLNKFTPDGIELGMNYLHEAVEKDPEEPLAYAGLALGYDILAHTPSPPPDAIPLGRAAALKALELDDSLAEVHLALAMIKIYADWNREGAIQSYQRALELNPSLALAHGHYAWAVLIEGQVDEAVAELYKAQALDPLEPIYPSWQAGVFSWNGDHDQAIEEALKAVELAPEFPVGLANLGAAYGGKGMYEEAIAAQQKASEISPAYKGGLGHALALAGQRDEALQVAAELESQPDVWNAWGLAEIYTALGDRDEAFRWLEVAYEQRHPYIQWFKVNPNFNPLREDPRYDDLAQRLDLPE
jgi:tetratricopeptide (TPR) repeat protein